MCSMKAHVHLISQRWNAITSLRIMLTRHDDSGLVTITRKHGAITIFKYWSNAYVNKICEIGVFI